MDAVDRQLIQALRENGRASYAELGRLVGLSGPSVTDRINRLEAAGVAVSMDGRGRALDNVFVERLWRSVKYEHIYIQGYDSVPGLHRGLARYFAFYNDERPHQSLGYRTPAAVYRSTGAGKG